MPRLDPCALHLRDLHVQLPARLEVARRVRAHFPDLARVPVMLE